METKDLKKLKKECIEWYNENISADMHDRLYEVKEIYHYKFSDPLLFLNLNIDDQHKGCFFLFSEQDLCSDAKEFIKYSYLDYYYIYSLNAFREYVMIYFIQANFKEKILEFKKYKSSKDLKLECIDYYDTNSQRPSFYKSAALFDLKLVTNRALQILMFVHSNIYGSSRHEFRYYFFFAINNSEEEEIQEVINNFKKNNWSVDNFKIIRNYIDFVDTLKDIFEIK
jgi:hypothetical protein